MGFIGCWRPLFNSDTWRATMSSEAAAYFPDALTTTSEVRGAVQGAAASPSGHPGNVRHDTSETSSNTVIPITEISDEVLLQQMCQGTKEALGIPVSPPRPHGAQCRLPHSEE